MSGNWSERESERIEERERELKRVRERVRIRIRAPNLKSEIERTNKMRRVFVSKLGRNERINQARLPEIIFVSNIDFMTSKIFGTLDKGVASLLQQEKYTLRICSLHSLVGK